MSKTIEIKKSYIRNLLLSFVLGFGLLYILNHFGKFSYIADSPFQNSDKKPSFNRNISSTTKISMIFYDSFFNNRVETKGNGFDLLDLKYPKSDFNKYSVKSYYYTQATIKDYKYAIYISLGLFVISLFFNSFKIKLT